MVESEEDDDVKDLDTSDIVIENHHLPQSDGRKQIYRANGDRGAVVVPSANNS